MKTAVSFVANDKIIHYLQPFLASLRHHMPDQDVVMISYDANDRQTRELAARFDVRVMASAASDDIASLSTAIYGTMQGHFKKLEAFGIEADCVMMIDVDMIVLRRFDDLFSLFSGSGADFVFAETTSDFVYSEAGLKAFPASRLFSTGLMLFSPHKHDVASIRTTICDNLEDYLRCKHPYVYDQPLLNYYADKNTLQCRSVDDLSQRITGANFYLDEAIKVKWAESGPSAFARGKEVLMLHYAGLKDISGPFRYKDVLQHFQERAEARQD